MNRYEEVEVKHGLLRDLMAQRGADGILLRKARNIAWFTAGGDASLVVDSEAGIYSVLVTPERRIVVCNTIEEPRIRAEEDYESLGFEYNVTPWYAEEPLTTPAMVTDDSVEAVLQQMRWILLEPERERVRALGRDAAAAIEEAVRAVRPGDTEFDMAARQDAAVRRRGGLAVVNLIGTDERIYRFRHPLPTMKQIERYGLLALCMRRHGLVVSATRLVHFGGVPDELLEKSAKIAAIDAAVMVATQPGREFGDVFNDLIEAYNSQGETGQWTFHHQGGLAGYAPRERIVTPGDSTVVQPHQLFAWNPSIVGCKSEDTILLGSAGDFEIVTQASDAWPKVSVTVDGVTVQRPGILAL